MVPALLAGLPALAQTLSVSGVCMQQCGAPSRQVRDNRPELQACLIRCNAAQDYDRAMGALPPQHMPSPRGRRSVQAESRRQAPSPAGIQAAAPNLAIAPPRGLPHAAAASPPPAGRATQIAVVSGSGGAGATAPGGRGWGAAYLAAAPATDFGLTAGLADRLTAHARAQSTCGAGGTPCRAALEFTDRCGAVAQARRTLGLFRTADPRSYSVSYAAAGSGPTREAAERAAIDECQARERTTRCEVAASSCGRP